MRDVRDFDLETGHAKLKQAKFEGQLYTIPRRVDWKVEKDE